MKRGTFLFSVGIGVAIVAGVARHDAGPDAPDRRLGRAGALAWRRRWLRARRRRRSDLVVAAPRGRGLATGRASVRVGPWNRRAEAAVDHTASAVDPVAVGPDFPRRAVPRGPRVDDVRRTGAPHDERAELRAPSRGSPGGRLRGAAPDRLEVAARARARPRRWLESASSAFISTGAAPPRSLSRRSSSSRRGGIGAYLAPLPTALRIVAVLSISIGLARPETYRIVKHEIDSVDIMLVMDMSKSMEETDLQRDSHWTPRSA